MGKYTINTDPDVDKQLDSYFNIIVKRVVNLVGSENIKAILISGGFGRGEGGVEIIKGKVRPINDFDLSIVVSKNYKKIKNQKIKQLRLLEFDLAKEIGIKQVDFGINHRFRFHFLSNRVSTYDLVNGYHILYGSLNISRLKSKYENSNLPLIDGSQFFLSRGSGMLLAALSFVNKKIIDKKFQENFFIENNKLNLSIGDSYLLMKGEYHYSYKKRISIVEKFDFMEFSNASKLKKNYISALKWKLNPSFNWEDDSSMIDLWFENRELFSNFFLRFESLRLNFMFKDWAHYCNNISRLQKPSIHNIVKANVKKLLTNPKDLFRTGITRKDDLLINLSIMPCILFSLKYNNLYDEKLLSIGINNIETHYGLDTLSDWASVAKKYISLFHPGGFVATVIKD